MSVAKLSIVSRRQVVAGQSAGDDSACLHAICRGQIGRSERLGAIVRVASEESIS